MRTPSREPCQTVFALSDSFASFGDHQPACTAVIGYITTSKLKTYLSCRSRWLVMATRRCCGVFFVNSAQWYKWLYLLTYLLTYMKYFGDVHPFTHRCCSFTTAISRPRWHRRPTRTIHSVWLLHFPRVRTNNLEQTSTGAAKHRYYREQFKHIRLKGYLSVRMAGGASDRHDWRRA